MITAIVIGDRQQNMTRSQFFLWIKITPHVIIKTKNKCGFNDNKILPMIRQGAFFLVTPLIVNATPRNNQHPICPKLKADKNGANVNKIIHNLKSFKDFGAK